MTQTNHHNGRRALAVQAAHTALTSFLLTLCNRVMAVASNLEPATRVFLIFAAPLCHFAWIKHRCQKRFKLRGKFPTEKRWLV
jgi:hypothetical protein